MNASRGNDMLADTFLANHKFKPGVRLSGNFFSLTLVPIVAPALRVLPDFSVICRVKLLIFFALIATKKTLDLRIGVRVPASQPN